MHEISKGLLPVLSLALLMGQDPSWRTKPTAQWTEEDARQLLTRSPWVREIPAGIARRLTEDELREGGQMGAQHGVGFDGVDPKGSGPKLPTSPKDLVLPDNAPSARSRPGTLRVKLRWESALPVRLAELKAHEMEPPVLEGDGYQIAVYGVPGGDFKGDPEKLGGPLKEGAALRREGKKDVKPVRVEVFQRADGLVVAFLFPMSAELTKKDGQVEFEAHIGRVVVVHRFDLTEMEFMGKLEL